MHPHSTDGEGAQVALLQSPILPAVLTPYTKRKIYRPPLTNHIPEISVMQSLFPLARPVPSIAGTNTAETPIGCLWRALRNHAIYEI
jgi:hypothetical protein